jgi:hypothetical protein
MSPERDEAQEAALNGIAKQAIQMLENRLDWLPLAKETRADVLSLLDRARRSMQAGYWATNTLGLIGGACEVAGLITPPPRPSVPVSPIPEDQMSSR